MLLSHTCTTETIITINNNNHNDNNNQGNSNNATESKRVVPPDNATKSVGVDVEVTVTGSTTTTGVGLNDKGYGTWEMDQIMDPMIINVYNQVYFWLNWHNQSSFFYFYHWPWWGRERNQRRWQQ